MAESIVSEATAAILNRNDMFDAASLKLGAAQAIVDVVVMLNVADSLDSLRPDSLTDCLMHADKLLDEAKEMFCKAHSARVTV
jgi:hypothetical protein